MLRIKSRKGFELALPRREEEEEAGIAVLSKEKYWRIERRGEVRYCKSAQIDRRRRKEGRKEKGKKVHCLRTRKNIHQWLSYKL